MISKIQGSNLTFGAVRKVTIPLEAQDLAFYASNLKYEPGVGKVVYQFPGSGELFRNLLEKLKQKGLSLHWLQQHAEIKGINLPSPLGKNIDIYHITGEDVKRLGTYNAGVKTDKFVFAKERGQLVECDETISQRVNAIQLALKSFDKFLKGSDIEEIDLEDLKSRSFSRVLAHSDIVQDEEF